MNWAEALRLGRSKVSTISRYSTTLSPEETKANCTRCGTGLKSFEIWRMYAMSVNDDRK